MKAAQISNYGNASVIEVHDIDKPEAAEGQVLVRVSASSINPFDTAVRSGSYKEMIPLDLPVTLGGDIAGVVEVVGEGVDNFAVGDKVYGQANVVAGNSGAFAQYAVVSAGQIAKMPEGLDFKQAASLPLAGVSALQALTRHIKLEKGQKIFIHGGSGGIGTLAIQIAKHIGAYVAASATGDGVEYVKNLGADEVIDYKTKNFAEELSGYDAVFDTVGGEDFIKSFSILKKGGVAVSMIAQVEEAKAFELGITALTQATQVTTVLLDELSELVKSNVLYAQVEKVFSLDQIQEAFEAKESGNIKGKIVIEIQ